MMVQVDSHMNSMNVIRLYPRPPLQLPVPCGPLPKSSVNWVRIWELSEEIERQKHVSVVSCVLIAIILAVCSKK